MHDPLPEPEKPQKKGWAFCSHVVRAHWQALDQVLDLASDEPYPGHDFEYGVLYVGGGRYWPGIVVGCRLLRRLGYRGPIEVWHGHRDNPEPIRAEDVAGLDVRVVNALEVAEKTKPRILRGWEAKLHALRHCRFRRVLFLDADAYAVVNPEPYFSRFSSFAFWRDTASTVRWDRVWPDTDRRDVPPVQGGQFFCDREKTFPLIVVADWICQHSDFYFAHLYGDQDAIRVALSLRDDVEYEVVDHMRWYRGAGLARLDGKHFVVHRCQAKLFPVADWNARDTREYVIEDLPYEFYVQTEYAKLVDDRDCRKVFSTLHRLHRFREVAPGLDDGVMSLLAGLVLSSPTPIRRIVDIGCGRGEFTERLAEAFPELEVVGIDCVPEVLPTGNTKARYLAADVASEEATLDGDVLLAREVFPYWPDDLVVGFLRRVLDENRFRYVVAAQNSRQLPHAIPLGGYRGLSPRLRPLADLPPDRVLSFPRTNTAILVWTGKES